jgi:hypothetical protein
MDDDCDVPVEEDEPEPVDVVTLEIRPLVVVFKLP